MLIEKPSPENQGATPVSWSKTCDEFLRRNPGDPESMTTTIEFCREGEQLLISYYHQILTSANPNNTVLIDQKIQDLSGEDVSFFALFRSQENFSIAGDQIHFPSKENPQRIRRFWGLIKLAAAIDPRLPRFRYCLALEFPWKDKMGKQRGGEYFPIHSLWKRFVDYSGLTPDSPETQAVTLLSLQQLAKIMAVEAVKGEIKRKRLTTALLPGRIEENLTYLRDWQERIEFHLGYIQLTRTLVNDLKETHSLSTEKIQILADLVFLHRLKLDTEALHQFLDPIFTAIGRGDWESAFAHRNFLLRYFPEHFPSWRTATEETEEPYIKGLKGLADKIILQEVALSLGEIPLGYQDIVADLIEKRGERVTGKAERKEFLRRAKTGSVLLLQTLIALLSGGPENEGRFNPKRPISLGNKLRVSGWPRTQEFFGHNLDAGILQEEYRLRKTPDSVDPATGQPSGAWVSLPELFATQIWKENVEFVTNSIKNAFDEMKKKEGVRQDDDPVDLILAATEHFRQKKTSAGLENPIMVLIDHLQKTH